MKSWVLWHKPGAGLEPSVKRVYLDGDRAREDFELLNAVPSSAWQLDEFEVFGEVAHLSMTPAEVATSMQEYIRNLPRFSDPPMLKHSVLIPQKPLAEMTFAERCRANPHMVVGWCRQCNAPADDLEVLIEGDAVSALVTHHGTGEMVKVPERGAVVGVNQIMVEAFKAVPETA